MKYVYSVGLIILLLFISVPLNVEVEAESIIVHENVIVEQEVEIYEGFSSPNEMVYIFVLIVLLSIIGLGIINAIE